MKELYQQIIDMSYGHFESHPATPDTFRDYIERMKRAYEEYDIDEIELFNLLETAHSPTIFEDAGVLEDNEDHEDWFNPITNLHLKQDLEWHFWSHYREFLKYKRKWPKQIVESLDKFSSLILSKLEDPCRKGAWDRRGMVVGNVQSGKTANYTALITKAVDAGYKFIVVMAGVHNSLRSQTQARINEEFLGYDLDVIQRITGEEKKFGVRKMFNNHRIVNTLTSSAENGDFSAVIARQAGIIPSSTGDPLILIVKKNVTILKNLIKWATSLGTPDSQGRKIISEVPLLLIDDECDYASVNTKMPERDENGDIIEEWDPAKTNLRIRQLLTSFSKSIYVGYTATPFANIFIHKDDPHPKHGKDLFPKHFLVNLPQPSNYIGPEQVFGLEGDRDSGIEEMQPLPLVKVVDDTDSLIPNSHKSDLVIECLPESLKEALKYFVLSCAARRIRSIGNPHNTFLVHVTRFNLVQKQVYDMVAEELKILTGRLMSGTDKLEDFRSIWEDNFISTSLEMKSRGFGDAIVHDWDVIKAQLHDAIRVIKIRGVNGAIADTLEYREKDLKTKERQDRGERVPWVEKGASLIAIGGDKLSRGLTLEGLSISYYLRSSRMYDTLMQMGRWFGYRDGYNDLCRIFMTGELNDWYRHIALANRELKNEFDYMETTGSTPEKFGLKVRSHPGRLAITSAGKARATETMQITFAGRCQRTVVFDPRHSENNRKALADLISELGDDYKKVDPRKPRYHWEGVPAEPVVDFLKAYKTQEEAKRVVDPARHAEYIEKQLPEGELTSWHVVIVSNNEHDAVHTAKIGGLEIGSVQRTPLRKSDEDRISIGTLTSPSDEHIDLSDEDYKVLKERFEEGKGQIAEEKLAAYIRQERSPAIGLLLIYLPANSKVASKDDSINPYGLKDDELVGFAVSFPGSETARPITYVVNSVFVEQEA